MCPQRIDQHCALANQSFPTPMEQYSSLLVSRLNGYEAHRRSYNRLADRFRIRSIVLVALHIGFHVLRWHQPHLVAQRTQLPPQSCAVAQASIPTRQRGSFQKNASNCARRSCSRTTVAPSASTPCTWKTCFAKSNPTVVISPMDGSLFAGCFEQPALWHLDAARGPSTPSFDHLVGGGEQLRMEFKAER